MNDSHSVFSISRKNARQRPNLKVRVAIGRETGSIYKHKIKGAPAKDRIKPVIGFSFYPAKTPEVLVMIGIKAAKPRIERVTPVTFIRSELCSCFDYKFY
jgi:hypothetical protein